MTIRGTPNTGHRFHYRIEPLEARIAPATFLVTSVADAGPGTLRQAIINANGSTNVAVPDVINFNLGTGPFKIQPLTQLPDVTEAVIIDGYSQSGATANTLPVGSNANVVVELSGALLASGNGLVLAGGVGGSTVKGLAINSFGTGVNESGYGIILKSNNNHIEGNFIGTNALGVASAATENKNAAVRVGAFSGTTPFYAGNIIGGTTAASRNLLTGNAYGVQLDEQSAGTQIYGNLIGLDKAGNAAYGNLLAGISDFGAASTVIGDNTANGRNIISGSGGPGIAQAVGPGIQIRGNYIGTNAAGTAGLGNTGAGIRITNDASGGLIEGNYISGNVAGGIQLGSPVGDGGASSFDVRGNFIGIGSGGSALPNDGPGVAFFQGASGHTIGKTGTGQDNIIAFNKGAGIQDFGGGKNNRFYRNNINSNGGLEIDLLGSAEDFFGVTPNDSPDSDGVTNWPVIQTFNNTGSAVTLTGALNALSNATYRVEFFLAQRAQVDVSGHGGGVSFIGFQDVTTNGSGAGTFNFNIGLSAPADSFFTATATPAAGGSTSEFGPTKGPTASYTWTGATNSDWFTPGNWSPAVVPSPLDNVTFASGFISLTGPAAVANFTQTGGTLAGAGELTALAALTWSGGTHTGGKLRLNTGGTGTIGVGGAALIWSGGVLENYGALTVGGLGVDFNQGDFVNGAQTAVVTLNARLTDSDGAGTVATVSNAGTIVKMGSGSFGFGGINVSNSETIRAVAGTLVVGGITQSSGVLELAGGGIFSTGPISLNGGELVGDGTITGNVSNSGGTVFVGPKGAAGTLNITGNYSQGSTGSLSVDLGGTTPGTQHDRLNVSGNTALDGSLEHELLGTFVVRVGDTFNVLSSGTLGGTFTSTIGSPPIPTVYAGGLVSLAAVGFNVTNTNDSGAGSLRQAILDANAQSGLDYISFNIPGGGLKTIAPLTVLPSIGGDTVIDAYSQPGAVVNTLGVGTNAALLIELSGVNVPGTGGFESGLVAASGNVTISGFIINRWADYGIMVTTPTNGSTITGNWIGTDSTGNSAPTNTQTGVFIENAPFISVGSALSRGRNLISGNNGYGVHVSGSSSTPTFIQGNYIGTKAAGDAALGNGLDGVRVESGGNFIGGSGDGPGNVISGNAKAGIVIIGASATGNTIQGNLIGTNASGTAAVSNNDRGIKLVSSSATTIGGSFGGAGNVISGNLAGAFQGEGILVDASNNNFIQGNFIGTNKAGTASIGLQSYGIELANASTGNHVGGSANSGGNEGNVISGNLNGGIIISGNSDGAIIEGNRIGTDGFGVGALGNGGAGIAIIVSNNCIIGGTPETGNIIAFNAGPGVQVIDASASGNTIRFNSIYSNTGLGIDLGTSGVTANDALDVDSGANGLLNFPTLTTYTAGTTPTISGSYSGLANQTFLLDFYASNTADSSGNGEGRYYLGAFMVTTNGSGTASFTAPLNGFIPAGGVISATATQNSNFNTSEFSGIVSTSTTRTWDAGGGGNTDWFTAANWSGDVVPGAGDTAILNTNVTITLSGNASVFTFTQSAGTLTGAGTLTASNDFGWSGGTQSGTGTTKIPVGAMWNLTSNAPNMVLDGRTVNLDGTANFTGSASALLNNGATINNAGTFLFANDNKLGSNGGASTFNNLVGSVFRKVSGTAVTEIGSQVNGDVAFTNAGTVEVQSGTLQFSDTFTQSAGITIFSGGGIASAGGMTFAGGVVTGSGGFKGTINNTGAIFRPGGTGAAGSIQISSGSYTQGAGGTLEVELGGTGGGQFDVLSAAGNSVTLGGTLNIALINGFSVGAGNSFRVVQSGNNPGTFATLTGATAGLAQAADAGGLVLASTASATYIWDGEASNDWFNPINWNLNSGVPGPADTAILNINATITPSGSVTVGTFQQATGSIAGGSSVMVLNAYDWSGGTVLVPLTLAGGSSSSISGTAAKLISGSGGSNGIVNQGTINYSSTGTLDFQNGGFLSNEVGSTFNLTSDATMTHTGGGGSFFGVAGTFNKAGGTGASTFGTTNFSNTGTMNVQSGSMEITGVIATGAAGGPNGSFNVGTGATVTFTGDANFVNTIFSGTGTKRFTGGNIGLSGNIVAGGLEIASGNWTGTSTITDTLTWTAGNLVGLPTIAVGGTLNLSGSGLKFISGSGGFNGFINQGTMIWSGSRNFQIENGGFVSNEAGATFEARANAAMIQLGGGVSNFVNSGTFIRTVGTGTASISVNFITTGVVRPESGTLAFDSYTPTSGTTMLASGTLSSPNTMNFQGGELRGAGTIEGNVNNSGATVRPGGTGVAGTITITGNFTQGTTGTLSAELGGAGGGQSDVLSVGGSATLGGLLEVSFINGYAPAFGDTLNVITAGARSGTFNNTQGTSLLTVGYTATQAQLVRSAVSFSWDGGAGDTNWFNPMNWNPDFVPTANDNAALTINAVINLPSNASVASYSQTTGSLGGLGDLTVTGFFNWNGGQLDGGGGKLILPNGSVSGLSTGPWDLRRSVVQGGTFTVYDSTDLTFVGGLLFENSGGVVFGGSNFTIEARNAGGGTFRNLASGTLVINAPGEEMLGGTFENNGTVNLSANTSFKTTNGTSSGMWNLVSGSTFIFDHSGLATTLSGATFSGSGAVVVQGSSSLSFPIGSPTTFTSGVSFTQTNGQLVGPGSVQFAGTASFTGVALGGGVTATFTATSTLTNVNGGLSGGSALNTAGTSSFNGGFTFADGSVLTNSGALTIPNGAIADFINSSGGGSIVNASGAMFIKLPSGNNTAIQVPFANSGMVSISGQMTFTTFTQTTSGAALVLNNGVTSGNLLLNGGAFSGVGTHSTGSVTNAGATVRPGGLGARGTLHVNGYEQQSSGTLEIEIASVSDFDVLDLTGATTLGGGLSIDTVVPFLPATGNTFRVVTTAATPSGNFASFTGDVTRLSRSVDGAGVLLSSTTLTYVWDNSSTDGDWFNPLNWDLDSGTPGVADTAVVNIPTTIFLSTGVTVSAYVQSLGTINGPGQLTITDALTWSGGIIRVDVTTGAASVNTLGGGTATTLDNSLLDLGGTTTLSGSEGVNLAGNGTAELRNSGAFAFTGSAGITGTGTFHNIAGSTGVTKTVDVQVTIEATFLNGSALTVSDGFFALAGGGSWLSGISATVGATGFLSFTGGTHILAGDNQFLGAGTTRLDGGTLEVNGNGALVDAAHTFQQLSGTLSGTGDFVVNGAFIWNGGVQVGPGTTTLASTNTTAYITGSGAKTLDLRTLNVTFATGLVIDGDGQLDMMNGSQISVNGALALNAGMTINDAGGAPSSIDIFFGAAFSKLDNGTSTIGVPFSSAGTLNFSNGTVNFQGTFTQMGGTSTLSGGGIGFVTPGELRGGTLTGNGTITGSLNNTGGILNPGNGPGQLILTGDYIQSSVATLQLEITGTTAASGYDQLQVGGNASLDGSVSVFLAGFTPARGDNFRIISAGSVSGTFSTLQLPPLFEADYTAISVDLSLPFLPPGVISLGELDGTNGFLIPGLTNGSATGNSVAAIGDINGDSIGDFAIGAPNENGGATYVVFGKANGFGATLDLTTLDGTNGFTIIDSVNGGRSGFSLSGLGDVNGDGIADIFIGAPDSAVAASNAGAAYILFGKETSFTATVDLGTATGSSVLQIIGVNADDLAGFSVSNAGDINNDGASDIIIGVPFSDLNGADSGAAYVVFGAKIGAGTLPSSISLSGLDGTAGFRLVGEQANDHFGTSVSTAGDINSDGFDDILIGAPDADSVSGITGNGAAYVFLGKATGFTASTDVSTFDGKNGFKLEGLAAGEAFGSSVATAGDVNGDGVSDIIIGAANHGTGQIGVSVTGVAYVVFGKAKAYKPTFDLHLLDGSNGFRLTTAFVRSNNGISVSSAGDFNNDGFDDVVVGAPSALGDAGITYVLLGRKTGFASALDLEALTGTTGFRFVGGTADALSGTSVSGGDINGDGFDDIFIGSPQPGSESQSAGNGGAIVLYGHATRAIPVVPNTNTTAVFEDGDHDKITITVTGGKITADMLTFGADGGLQMVDLTDGGYKDGASITFSVKKKVGDGIFNVGAIDATGIKLGKVSVTGDLGQIDVGNGDPLKNAIKFLNVGSLGAMGGTTQIPGTDDPLISTIRGALPKVMVKGNVTNATLNVLGKLGSFTVGGSFTGTGAFSSSQLAGLAALGHGQIGHVSGGTTLASSGLTAGSIGKLTVKGGLTNSAISSSSSISSATINGDFTKSALVAATTTGAVKVLGKLIGDATTPSVISARGPLNPTSQAKSVAISSLTIKKDVANAEILIGYDKTFVPTNGDASIGTVTINGNWTASSLVAGIKDDTDNGFGLDDVPIPGFDATPTVFSRIASLIIKGTVTSSPSATDTYAITAQQIGKVKIGTTTIVLDKLLPDNLLIAPTDDFRLVEVF